MTRGNAEQQKVREDLLAGRAPFESIQLVLVSHPHREHFHAATAGEFLKNHPQTVLASSPDVIQEIRQGYPQYESIQGQLQEMQIPEGEVATFAHSGIRVDFLPFDHEASAF